MSYLAVIEWGSDSIEEPTVLLHADIGTLTGLIVGELKTSVGDEPLAYTDDEQFLRDNPYPDASNVEACRSWLLAMREATTVPWVEVYYWEPLAGDVKAKSLPFSQAMEGDWP